MLEKYLKEELIILNLDVANRDELFEKVSAIYEEKQLVTESFHKCLSERENNFPTGLQMDDYAVAIPHGEPENVKESFVSIVTLVDPISIHKMENPAETIPVDLFFFLGLGDGALHLGILRETISLIQEKALVEKLKKAASSEEALEMVKEVIKSNSSET